VIQTPVVRNSSTHAASSSSARQPGALLDPPSGWLGTASHLGPGLIISAAIVGSGELIVTPKVGAALGFSMLWFVILGCIVKVFVQIELARFAIVERVTTLEALNSVPGPRVRVSWLLWLWLFMYLGLVFQVAGLIGGCVLIFETMNFDVSREALLIVITGSGALLLVTGRYKVVEMGATLMVAAFTLSTVVAMIALQWTPYRVSSAQLLDGLTFQLPASFTVAFAAFGIIGVGASELIYYPYWCLEKGYARHIGPRDDSPDWRRRMLGWLRVLHADAALSMLIYTGATIAFYILGAAVLHGQGLQVTDRQMIDTLGQMYRQTLGAAGAWIFLVGAFAVLYSTFFVATASNARLFADAAAIFGAAHYKDESARLRMVRAACVGLPVASGTVYFLFPQPVILVLIGAVGQGVMLPFLGAAALYFHHRHLAGVIHNSAVWTVALWLSALAMMLTGGYQLVQTLLPLL
jgi:Mn2+/Fe2+ NRAMP family transporter